MQANNFIITPDPIGKDDFVYFRGVLKELTGISLADAKIDLLQARVRTQMEASGITSFKEYRKFLENLPKEHPGWQDFINVLTTNKTDWFREYKHFEFLTQNYLPNKKFSSQHKLQVWSAASSSGEEPYSLAMEISKSLSLDQFQITATDIDTKMVQICKNGVYPADGLTLVPEEHTACFIRGKDGIKDWMRVRNDIKKLITFKQLNLMNAPYGFNKSFDLIFCRNVLIYFNRQTVEEVIQNLYENANPGAYLFIGHSESLHNIRCSWKSLRPSIYIKK